MSLAVPFNFQFGSFLPAKKCCGKKKDCSGNCGGEGCKCAAKEPVKVKKVPVKRKDRVN